MKLRSVLVLCAAAAFGGGSLTGCGIAAYATAHDAVRAKAGQPTAYSDFLFEIQAGQVKEVQVEGRYCFYDLELPYGIRAHKWTMGPSEGLEDVHPDDPHEDPPSIIRR